MTRVLACFGRNLATTVMVVLEALWPGHLDTVAIAPESVAQPIYTYDASMYGQPVYTTTDPAGRITRKQSLTEPLDGGVFSYDPAGRTHRPTPA